MIEIGKAVMKERKKHHRKKRVTEPEDDEEEEGEREREEQTGEGGPLDCVVSTVCVACGCPCTV